MMASIVFASVPAIRSGETVHTEYARPEANPSSHTPGNCAPTGNYNLIGPEWTSFPVKYQVDTSRAPSDVRSGARNEIVAGFEAWEGITSIPNFFERVSSSLNRVRFSTIDGPGGILAQVQLSWSGNTFTKFTMTFDRSDNWEIFNDDVCPTPDGRVGYDIREVAAHEAGHVVGLHHSTQCETCGNRALTMYPYILAQGETYKRSPESGDKLGMQTLYA